mgnify:CR=1 FL=1
MSIPPCTCSPARPGAVSPAAVNRLAKPRVQSPQEPFFKPFTLDSHKTETGVTTKDPSPTVSKYPDSSCLFRSRAVAHKPPQLHNKAETTLITRLNPLRSNTPEWQQWPRGPALAVCLKTARSQLIDAGPKILHRSGALRRTQMPTE